MDKEEIMVNLKVLEGLQKNQKIVSRGQYINIEIESIVPEFLRRWRRQDNRNETLKKINTIVNSAIEFVKTTDKQITEHGQDHLYAKTWIMDKNNMINHLTNALKGIHNLKETYATCTQTCARIDITLTNITGCLDLMTVQENE